VKELRAVSPCRQAMDCLAWLTGADDTFIPYELYGFPGYRFLKLKSLDNPTSMILRRVEDMYVPFFLRRGSQMKFMHILISDYYATENASNLSRLKRGKSCQISPKALSPGGPVSPPASEEMGAGDTVPPPTVCK
jgi:hypothetical protein